VNEQRGAIATIDLPIRGMDCADEATQIEAAVGRLPGVSEVKALVSAQRATVVYDPDRVTPSQIATAIGTTGCSVRSESTLPDGAGAPPARRDAGEVIGWGVLGMVALVVLVAALGERLGLLDAAVERVPWWVPAVAIVLGGWKVFRGVLIAAQRLQVTSHTLMASA
jgi:cation transport ATPase